MGRKVTSIMNTIIFTRSVNYKQARDFDDVSSFFWYVADDVRVCINSVDDSLDIEMDIL